MPEPQSATAPGLPRTFVGFAVRERIFLIALLGCFMLAAFTFRIPHIAMWVGFAFAGYSAVANDSIQTLGTFIASNREQKWWVLWMYIGGIFVVTMVWGWLRFDGDISYQRLTTKGFEIAPTSFSFLQITAPLFLLIITRLRMPVSTSILLLSCFATESSGITSTLAKSVGGYVIAFVASIVIWGTLGRWMQRRFVGVPHPAWRVVQYITTGGLWAVWLAQDAANIAVYLPRTLTVMQLVPFLGFIVIGLGMLFYQRGEKIQEVVEEKSAVADVRPAAVVDLVYGLILFYKMTASTIPMSTTWVFIGLLGGRELALTWWKSMPNRTMADAVRMVLRDLSTVALGLVMSLTLAVMINDVVRHAWAPALFDAESGACVHATSGRANARIAIGSTPEVADIDTKGEYFMESHHRYDVLFMDAGPSHVLFAAHGGPLSLHLSEATPFTLIAADGSEIAMNDEGRTDVCGPLDVWFTADLPTGIYTLRFAENDAPGVTLVIED